MNKRSGFLLKNVGMLTISNFASKILVFFLVPVYTNALSTQDYGTFDLAISTVTMLYPILTVNIVDAVMRFCLDDQYDKGAVIAIGKKYMVRSIAVAGLLALSLYFGKPLDLSGSLVCLVFLYYTAYAVHQFAIQLAKGLERVKDMAIAGVAGTVVMVATNILFLVAFPCGLPGFFVANILAQAVPAVFLAIKLKAWIFEGSRTDLRLQKEMLAYCAPLIFTVLGWWINSAADRYVVTYLCGVAASGILSVAYKIPGIINILQGIFIQAWQISAMKEYGESDTAKFYGGTFSALNTLMCAACAWLILLTRPIAGMLFAKDFYEGWQYVPFLLISSVLNCASGFLGPILSAKKDSKAMARSAIDGSAINVVLNISLVSWVGIQGAAIATAISSYAIYAVRRKAAGDDIRMESYGRVLATWGLLCVQAVVEIYMTSRYLEIGLMLMMLWVNRNSVRSLFDMVRKIAASKLV